MKIHKDNEQKPVIAYGAANFPSHGKGELSVPVKYIKKKCQQHFETVFVDEFRTSKICPHCDKPLCEVIENKEVEGQISIRQVRELRRCQSSECSKTSFKNRDFIAAINIRRCLVDPIRPTILTRKEGQPALQLSKFTLRNNILQ